MRLKRLVVTACSLLVAAVAAIAIAVALLVPRWLAPSLAAAVRADTGRELSFGDVGMTLWPWPALAVSKLRLGNAPWGSQPWLAQVDRASVEFDTLALLSGRLRIRQVTLNDATLLLETDAEGAGNWVMGSSKAGQPASPNAFEIDELTLRSLAFTYRDGKTGKALSVLLDSARFAAAPASQSINLDVRAAFDGKSVEAAGTVGPLAAMIANAPWPIDVEGRFGAASVSVRGSVDKPLELDGFSLALKAQAAEAAEVATLFGVTVPPLGPLRGAAQLSGTLAAPALTGIDIALGGRGAPQITLSGSVADLRAASGIDVKLAASATEWWRLGTAASGPRLPPFRATARVRGAGQAIGVDDLELKVADSTVNASLRVVQGGPRLRITGKLTSPLVDLSRRPPARGTPSAPAAVPAPPRPTDHWKLADVALDLQIARLVFPGGRELRSGSGRFALENGRLNANALQATLGGASVKLDGSVADPANLAGIDLDVALQGGELAELLTFFGTAVPPVGPYQGQARLQGSLDALRLTAIDATAGRPGQRLRASGQIDDVVHGQGLALAVTADVSDSTAAGRLFGADLPRLPALRASAQLSGPQGGYVFDDLTLALGRTAVQGRVVFAPGAPRPRVTAQLSGPLVDLSELLPAQPKPGTPKPGASNPSLAADVDADIRFDRVVLPDRRALGPVSGGARLTAGAVELKQFSVAVEGASATVDGTIGDPGKPAALDLMLNAEVKHGAGLAAFTGMNLRELPAFTASARLTDVPDGVALGGLKLVHAATTITGDMALTRAAKRIKVSAKLSSPMLDASAFMQPPAASGTAKPAAAGTRAIADVPLPVDALLAVDADVDLRIDSIQFGGAAPLGPLLLHAVLADGRLTAGPMQLAGPASQTLSASATVDATQATWALRADGKAVDLGAMLTRFGHPGTVTGGRTDLTVQFRGRGKTLPAVLGSLDGDARVELGPLRLHNVAIDLDRGIVARAFGLANPVQKTDPFTDITCLVVRVPIKNGLLTSDRGIAAETTKVNIVLSGSVNLRTEALDIAVTPIVKGGLGAGTASIAQIVRVGGTLGAPALGVDPVGAVKSAVGAGVAVMATPWWLADTVLKKMTADQGPCATALAK